ncbi:MAG: hypothetical protein C0596_05835 [Marinilabiliales bacterium]|nr:MAG: hypothetical protein C0596_05835 [Marinilabiliales bacterium]
MKKNLIYIIIIAVVGVVAFFVIRHFVNRNPLDVDVSDIELEVKIERFDRDIKQINNSFEEVENIYDKYGYFFEVYNYDIIGIGGIDNSSYLVYLNTFLNDYAVVEASTQVDQKYSDCSDLNNELTEGFKHLIYYYPDVNVPRIVSFVAGFNQSVVITEGFIGVGLDKYLGEDCELYDMLGIPEYAKREMTESQIPIDVMTAWAQDKYPMNASEENLLNFMIYNGKILYFLDAMYPDFDEARKNKFTEEQLAFCYHFERDIWTSLVENKLLFVTDYLTIKKFVENAPYTNQFGQDSPPRVANWIGLQIVRAYMDNNNVSVPELMEENDYQKILNLSEYNPKYD